MVTPGAVTDPPRATRLAASALAAAIALAAAVGDAIAPPEVNLAIAYVLVVAVAAWSCDPRVIWAFAAACIVLAFVGTWLGPLERHRLLAYALLNRSLASMAILAAAGAGHSWIVARRNAVAAASSLVERNTALEATNVELSLREEEIARQNEELVSQSEELERQSEELRLANDELAVRERMLSQLLDLSRTLAKQVTSADVMATICEALTHLAAAGSGASAIFFRNGNRLDVRCHHAFGPDGPDIAEVPFEQSFTALVMSRAATAYLEDASLRPDLRLPRGGANAVYRSVLAAPIWLQGQVVGTLELYRPAPSRWADEQAALITSLAAQASISLEAARLFEEVGRERRRFETVFHTLPVAVMVADDPECRHVSGNPAAATLFVAPVDANFSPFAPPGELIRRTDYRDGKALAPEEFPLVRAIRQREQLRNEEFDIVFADGRRVSALVSTAPIFDAAGRVTGGVCALADVTHLKRLERDLQARRRELEEASARKTRFLAAASHDIRTPANAIRLLAEIIKRSAGAPDAAERVPALAQDLERNAASLVELVSEALDLARFDSGRIELEETEFSLAETIGEECRQLRHGAEAKGLALVCNVPADIWLRADRVKLARILGNLIDNGIKFTTAGEVGVTARRTADRGIDIRVEDTGSGILPEDRERIFDEFFQSLNPARDRARGRGLGLAICRRLVTAMGGAIELDTEVGRGAAFTVHLPASSVLPPRPAPRADVAARRPALGLDGMRVLLVEDHASTREALAALLAVEGATVAEAPDARSAIDALADVNPHVVLLDLMLPDMDGTEVLKAICDERPPALHGVFVLSGDFASRQPERFTRLGATAVLAKPVDPDQLLAHLRTFVAVRG